MWTTGNIIRTLLPAVIASGVLLHDGAAAAGTSAAARFYGTLVVVECTINNGTKQAVSFGDAVGIHRVDGKRYEQPVPFSVSCQNYGGTDVPALTLTLEGTATSFNDAAVATSVSGLGIEIRRNGVAQPLNSAVQFDYKNVPVLTAVPVADPSVDLSAQAFTATLKLTVEVA